jgi:hypothetical protein
MALWSVTLLGSTPIGGPVIGVVAQQWGSRACQVTRPAPAMSGEVVIPPEAMSDPHPTRRRHPPRPQ